MQVFLDGRLIDRSGSTLGHALDAAREHAGTRMIVQVLADGSPVPAKHLDAPPSSTPYARRLEFATADPDGLLDHVLRDTVHALETVRVRQASAAESLQAGRVEEAIGLVVQIIETWSGVRDALALVLRAAAGRYHDGADRELAEQMERLATELNEVKRCIAMNDWASLGDALGWGMQEQTDRCRLWLMRVLEQ